MSLPTLTRRVLAAVLAAAALPAVAAPPNPSVVITTSQGPIVIEVDVAHAPVTAANFLRYVDGGLFKGASFYRVVRPDNDTNPATITVIQGGLGDAPALLPDIAHETTRQTGLKHLDGTVSMARDAPGTASSEFFIVIGDTPVLDFGGTRNPDGQGFAVFGRVTEGMAVVRRINSGRASDAAGSFKGQRLESPVVIQAMSRVR